MAATTRPLLPEPRPWRTVKLEAQEELRVVSSRTSNCSTCGEGGGGGGGGGGMGG